MFVQVRGFQTKLKHHEQKNTEELKTHRLVDI